MRKIFIFLFTVFLLHNAYAETKCSDPEQCDSDNIQELSAEEQLWKDLNELEQALIKRLQELKEENQNTDSLSSQSNSDENQNRTSNGECKLTGAVNYASGACSCGTNAIQRGTKCVCNEAAGYFYRNGFCVKSASNTSSGRLIYGKDRTSF